MLSGIGDGAMITEHLDLLRYWILLTLDNRIACLSEFRDMIYSLPTRVCMRKHKNTEEH